jgi:hypothetical protein
MSKKNIILLIIIVNGWLTISYSQVQIGQDIIGDFGLSNNSISINAVGNIVAIGNLTGNSTSGSVRIYKNISGTWTQLGQEIIGEASLDYSGTSVSLNSSGNIIAIGATGNNGNGIDSGHVRVYENISDTWVQIGQDINGENGGDQSGVSVSLNAVGNIVAIGSGFNSANGLQSGHVRLYENIAGTWTQIGQDIDGENIGGRLGWSLELNNDGNIVAIGAYRNNGNGFNSGHVRVFKNISGVWSQIGQDIDGEATEDESGFSISINANGNVVAIGAPKNDGNGFSSGHVRVYQNISGNWLQIGVDIDGVFVNDQSGNDVSLNGAGNILAVGAPGNDGNDTDTGRVRLYKNTAGTWTQLGNDIYGVGIFDSVGRNFSLSEDASKIAIGFDGNTANVRVYDLSSTLATESYNINGIVIYPNPTSDNIIVKLNQSYSYKIYGILGNLLQENKYMNEKINVAELPAGTYILEIKTEEKLYSTKFIKK